MNWLLDTCLLSEFVKRAPHQGVLDWAAAQPEESLCVSVLTIGEIERGIALLPASDPRSRRLRDWLDNRVLPRFRQRILPLGLEGLREWGRRAGLLEKAGRPASALDGLLAATAHVHQLQVVTRNEADFEPWGVDCLNPWR
jgi:predicted nucleic acid-binding protein